MTRQKKDRTGDVLEDSSRRAEGIANREPAPPLDVGEEVEPREEGDVPDAEPAEEEGVSVNKWAKAKSRQHEVALGFLTGNEKSVLRRYLNAERRLKTMKAEFDAVVAKLDRKVNAE